MKFSSLSLLRANKEITFYDIHGSREEQACTIPHHRTVNSRPRLARQLKASILQQNSQQKQRLFSDPIYLVFMLEPGVLFTFSLKRKKSELLHVFYSIYTNTIIVCYMYFLLQEILGIQLLE